MSPSRVSERVDQRDGQGQRNGELQRPAQLTPHAGAETGAEQGEDHRTPGQAGAPATARRRPAPGSTGSLRRRGPHAAGSAGAGSSSPRLHRQAGVWPPWTASAKWSCRRAGVSAAAAAATPAASVPVIEPDRRGDVVARWRRSVRRPGRGCAPPGRSGSSSCSEPAAEAGVDAAPSRPAGDQGRRDQRLELGPRCRPRRRASRYPSRCPAAGWPRGRRPPGSAADTRAQARLASGAHSSTVGSRLPPMPCTNGSGNEPTTAGTESVTLPVVEVPPDPVAAVDGGGGSALARPGSR